MKKRVNGWRISICCLMIMGMLGCSCEHQWNSATCTQPDTCEKCGATQGEPLGHAWAEATCAHPQTCSVCGATQGEALGHTWKEATCKTAKTCLTCGEVEGKPLGHTWEEKTCTEPKTCTVCGTTVGYPLGHAVESWSVVTAPTCTQAGSKTGTCTRCGETVTEAVEPAHTPGDWKIIEKATLTEPGIRAAYCTVCGEEAQRETYMLSDEEREEVFKAECETYSYEKISRNPSDYLMKKVRFRGEVIQVVENGDQYVLRVNVTKKRYFWDDTIYVEYTKQDASEPRILEDDIITIYGYSADVVTYETIFGASVTIPAVLALYIDIQ